MYGLTLKYVTDWTTTEPTLRLSLSPSQTFYRHS